MILFLVLNPVFSIVLGTFFIKPLKERIIFFIGFI